MNVVLSSKASRQLIQLFEYLEAAFSVATRRKFQQRFDKYVQAIKLIPDGFPMSPTFDGCRRCVVSKQTSIIYRVNGGTIEIVALLDNRQQSK